MRAFISLKLSDEAISEIKKIQKELEKKNLFIGKLTEEENLHLTIKFLGEIDDKNAEEVKKRLEKIKIKKFKVKLGNVGVFSEELIRIIWIKLNGEGVFELQKQIDESLIGLFDKEARFMGHITIARVKTVKNKPALTEFLKKVKIKGIDLVIDNFYLMKSELFPEGPRYNVIEEFGLLN